MSNQPFAPQGTVAHLFVVGAEDYVYRVIKAKLRAKGVTVTGHAPSHWQPPFAPPRGTTHLLVVEDDCPAPLRVHAQHLVHEISGLDVVLAPARNRWGETEELLRRHGVLELMEPRAAQLETAPDLRPTIGELIAAKARVEEVVIEKETVFEKDMMVLQPAPPFPEPIVVTPPELKLDLEPPIPEPPVPTSPPPPKPRKIVVAPQALAIEILKAIEGRMTDSDLALLVGARTGVATTAEQVAEWRRESNSSGYRRGSKPVRLLPAFARYGLTFQDASESAKQAYVTRRERKTEVSSPREEVHVTTPYVARFDSNDLRYKYVVDRIKKDPSITNWALDVEIKQKFGRMVGHSLKRVRSENGLSPSPGRRNGVMPQVAKAAPSPRSRPLSKPPPKSPSKAPPKTSDFADELRAALAHLHDLVIVPHHVSHLELVWDDGKWRVPAAERVTVVAGEVEI